VPELATNVVPGYYAPVYLLLLLLRHIYSACAIRVCMCMNACLLIVLLGLVTRFIISLSSSLATTQIQTHQVHRVLSVPNTTQEPWLHQLGLYVQSVSMQCIHLPRTDRERERERERRRGEE